MSSRNDEIRRQLGSAMPTGPRNADMVVTVRQYQPAEQCKQQDAKCDAADAVFLNGVMFEPFTGNQYFSASDDWET